MDREYLEENNPEVLILEPPSLDAAILGLVDLGDKEVLLYSTRKLIECFEKEGMSYDEAVEWVDFNVLGAYMGPYTPKFLTVEWGD
jgi:hypothetical protein